MFLLYLITSLPRISLPISVQMLEIDLGRLEVPDTEWNAFGLPRIRRGDIEFPPIPAKPTRIELPRKEKTIPHFPARGLKGIGKLLVYKSSIEKKVEVQVVQIRKIKRIGGEYPYGPRNGTVTELPEPIFVVRRVINEVAEPTYWEKFHGTRSHSDYVSWIPPDNSTIQHLPYRLISSNLRCRYCFSYWTRQESFRPENVYSLCCPEQKSL